MKVAISGIVNAYCKKQIIMNSACHPKADQEENGHA
jgi:hypothetical protein